MSIDISLSAGAFWIIVLLLLSLAVEDLRQWILMVIIFVGAFIFYVVISPYHIWTWYNNWKLEKAFQKERRRRAELTPDIFKVL